ncbi:MAG TPA: hypothetical protein VL135_11590 [Terracidiphilus sp.]|nr:hypothetical protein [Terracidiphilus sp.]
MTLKSSRREFLSAGLMLPVAAAASNTGLLQATDKALGKPTNSPGSTTAPSVKPASTSPP